MDPYLDEARELDAADGLVAFRSEFAFPSGAIYMLGNSLGLLPKRTAGHLEVSVLGPWGGSAIGGWNGGWIDLPRRLGSKIAGLIGACADEVVVGDSTSVNFYRLVLGALRLSGRGAVVTDEHTFPSNSYALQGCVPADRIRYARSLDGICVEPAAFEGLLGPDVGVLAVNHVAFKSGQLHDMKRLTDMAHRVGALVVWDLSHSVGVVPMQLREWGVDLAVGCTYKYLNGGPGAPAFMYVRRELQTEIQNAIPGWIGQSDPFEMGLGYDGAADIRRFLTGTPYVLSMAAIEPGVDLVAEAGVEALRKKSEGLTEFLIRLWRARLEEFSLKSPADVAQRGSHVSLGHPEAYGIDRALIERMNVIPDFRPPDNIRFGLSPLYVSFEDVWRTVEGIQQIVANRWFEGYRRDAMVT
jgi:kynureninase